MEETVLIVYRAYYYCGSWTSRETAEHEVFLPAGKLIANATSGLWHYSENLHEKVYTTVRCFSAANQLIKTASFSEFSDCHRSIWF